VGINAYHQPGVEAGKKAAGIAIDLCKAITSSLQSAKGESLDAPALAQAIGKSEDAELVYKLATHLAANGTSGIQKSSSGAWHQATFSVSG